MWKTSTGPATLKAVRSSSPLRLRAQTGLSSRQEPGSGDDFWNWIQEVVDWDQRQSRQIPPRVLAFEDEEERELDPCDR